MEISKIIQLKNLAEELIAEYEEDEFMIEDWKWEDELEIDNAINEIHSIYKAINHTWHWDDNIPTKEELKTLLLDLIQKVRDYNDDNEEDYEVATWWLFVRDTWDWVIEFWYERGYFINA